MQEKIRENLSNPSVLESLYRRDRNAFRKAFLLLYPDVREDLVAQSWAARFNDSTDARVPYGIRDWAFVVVAAVLAFILAKIPTFFSVSDDFYYTRNVGFLVFPFLSAYFLWKQSQALKTVLLVLFLYVASAVYINLLPDVEKSDTLVLACIHLLLFLWSIFAYSFMGHHWRRTDRRLDFLRYNGDLIVMVSLIFLSGGILSGITLGLFELIDMSIESFYIQWIVVLGLVAAPMVATHLVQTNPTLVNRISPMIARIFTPLVLVMLIVYLLFVFISGKSPYSDRDFLLVFNALLVGVMALLFFSVAESSALRMSRYRKFLVLSVSFLTLLINGIALSAIIFRISEWGITPNRLAVLGSNLLMFSHLLLVSMRMVALFRHRNNTDTVEDGIAFFLPVYSAWAFVVTFLFPWIFHFA